MERLQKLGFRGGASTPGSGFTVVAMGEIGVAFSDMAGFLDPGSYIFPTGLENFWRRSGGGGSISVVALPAGTRFLVLPCSESGRSL